jgi:hypothetical protein
VALVVDGPDPDNYLAILAAISQAMCFELVAVIMTGRPVSREMGAEPFDFNPRASKAVRRDNALHAKGILMRHGGEQVPVFSGGRAPFSTIPHHLHIHEHVTDVLDDAHAGHALAGNIDDAVVYLAGLGEQVHLICGGPLTDVAYLIRQPMLHGKLGIATAQLGMFGFNPKVQTFAGGRRQFNATADPSAAHEVLFDYPMPFYLVPTDITKAPELAFGSAAEIAGLSRSSAAKELAAMYAKAWPEMWAKMKSPAHVHDFHPVELMDSLLREKPFHHKRFSESGRDRIGRYTVSPVGIEHVPHLPHEKERWGEIDLGAPKQGAPLRFLTDGCDYSQHRRILGGVLNAVRSSTKHGALV